MVKRIAAHSDGSEGFHKYHCKPREDPRRPSSPQRVKMVIGRCAFHQSMAFDRKCNLVCLAGFDLILNLQQILSKSHSAGRSLPAFNVLLHLLVSQDAIDDSDKRPCQSVSGTRFPVAIQFALRCASTHGRSYLGVVVLHRVFRDKCGIHRLQDVLSADCDS